MLRKKQEAFGSFRDLHYAIGYWAMDRKRNQRQSKSRIALRSVRVVLRPRSEEGAQA